MVKLRNGMLADFHNRVADSALKCDGDDWEFSHGGIDEHRGAGRGGSYS